MSSAGRAANSSGCVARPTAREIGLTGFAAQIRRSSLTGTDFDVPSWYAVFLPKGTPAAIVQKLHDATVAAMGVSLIRERLKEIGCDLVPPERSSPEYLRKFVASEIDKWAGAIKASGVQID